MGAFSSAIVGARASTQAAMGHVGKLVGTSARKLVPASMRLMKVFSLAHYGTHEGLFIGTFSLFIFKVIIHIGM